MLLGNGVHFSVLVDASHERRQNSRKALVFGAKLRRAKLMEQAQPAIIVMQGIDWRGKKGIERGIVWRKSERYRVATRVAHPRCLPAFNQSGNHTVRRLRVLQDRVGSKIDA